MNLLSDTGFRGSLCTEQPDGTRSCTFWHPESLGYTHSIKGYHLKRPRRLSVIVAKRVLRVRLFCRPLSLSERERSIISSDRLITKSTTLNRSANNKPVALCDSMSQANKTDPLIIYTLSPSRELMSQFDIAIIGGGIYGCSVAKHLSERCDLDICIIEKEYQFAPHQSGRNSGTLTPGTVLNFEENELMGHFAETGMRKMKDYCRYNGISFQDYGLLTVAQTDEEEETLEDIKNRKSQNNVEKRLIDSEELSKREPHVNGQAALYAPESGAVDSQPITYSLASEAMNNGVEFFRGYEVTDVERSPNSIKIDTDKGHLTCNYFVNATGGHATKFAKETGVIGDEYYALPLRGQYYELRPGKRGLVNTNVYPTPQPDRIEDVGLHFTRRPEGKVIIGPTGMPAFGPESYSKNRFDLREVVEMVSSRGFWKFMGSRSSIRSAWVNTNYVYNKSKFVSECQKMVPELQSSDLVESYVGILNYLIDGDGNQIKEPVIEYGERSAHVLFVLAGVTSSLAIGEHVADQILKRY
jgi:L-2-hydroxyglutarate oxidase